MQRPTINLLARRNQSIMHDSEVISIDKKLFLLNAAYGVSTFKRNVSQKSLYESTSTDMLPLINNNKIKILEPDLLIAGISETMSAALSYYVKPTWFM